MPYQPSSRLTDTHLFRCCCLLPLLPPRRPRCCSRLVCFCSHRAGRGRQGRRSKARSARGANARQQLLQAHHAQRGGHGRRPGPHLDGCRAERRAQQAGRGGSRAATPHQRAGSWACIPRHGAPLAAENNEQHKLMLERRSGYVVCCVWRLVQPSETPSRGQVSSQIITAHLSLPNHVDVAHHHYL